MNARVNRTGGDTPHFKLAQTLKDTIDLVAHIGQYTKITGHSDKQTMAVCPLPQHDDKDASLSITPEKGFFYCHGCHATGTAVQFHMHMHGTSFREAVDELAQRYGLPPAAQPLADRDDTEGRDLALLDERAKLYHKTLCHPQAREAIACIKGRELTVESLQRFMIGYGLPQRGMRAPDVQLVRAGLTSKKGFEYMADRIVFPIRDASGVVRSFSGRIATGQGEADDRPKYLNGPETAYFSKGSLLYGLYEARQAIQETRRAIVVEGHLDVVMAHQHGFRNVVGSMGTALTQTHLRNLFRRADEIVVCFDPDAAGVKGAMRAIREAAPILTDDKRLSVLTLPAGLDPDGFLRTHGAEMFASRVASATAASRFAIEHLLGESNLRTVEGRAAFHQHVGALSEAFVAAPHFRAELCAAATLEADLQAMASALDVRDSDDAAQIEDALVRLQERSTMLLEALQRRALPRIRCGTAPA